MSDTFDHEMDAYESLLDGMEYDEPRYRNRVYVKETTMCKFCLQPELKWIKRNDKFVLTEKDGSRHTCQEYFKAKNLMAIKKEKRPVIKKAIIYICSDGKEFINKATAEEYERKLTIRSVPKLAKLLKSTQIDPLVLLDTIHEIMDEHGKDCVIQLNGYYGTPEVHIKI